MKIEQKAYKLYNQIQHYEWGTKNNEAFIPNFIGIDAIVDKAYAELWIGAHPKAPSEIIIEKNKLKLNDAIEKFPIDILGDYVAAKFNKKLPFLLKVLSAARALSIQTHPNKQQAELLHKKDPTNYPDENHKPEIAIALDGLTAIVGFRTMNEIKEIIIKHSELKNFVGAKKYEKIVNSVVEDLEENIKVFYSAIMQKSNDKIEIENLITQFVEKFTKSKNTSPEEKQFLEQYSLYGYDIGLLSFFLFNLIELKPRQGIFTEAGVPHAYIKGNIIECMANSDNVVRAGLTNKFKDVNVLLDILQYKFGKYEIINKEQLSTHFVYKTSASEFEVSLMRKTANEKQKFESLNKPVIYIVLNGSVEIICDENREQFFNGEVFLIPALVKKYEIRFEQNAEIICVHVP